MTLLLGGLISYIYLEQLKDSSFSQKVQPTYMDLIIVQECKNKNAHDDQSAALVTQMCMYTHLYVSVYMLASRLI